MENPENYSTIINRQKSSEPYYDEITAARTAFNSGVTRELSFRKKQLKNLLRMCQEKEEDLIKIFRLDLMRPKFETVTADLELLKNEIKYLLKHLDKWCKPENPGKRFFANFFDRTVILKEPLGLVLVIGAWNYPLHSTLVPLAGAIAGGNCAIIKPSDTCEAFSDFMSTVLPGYLDVNCFTVITGGEEETMKLLVHKFDYIFFTGSLRRGLLVQEKAAENVTPTTMEIGGKTPLFLDEGVDVVLAARRILWGKILNAGQACISPEYLLCTKEMQEKFIEVAGKVLEEFLGEEAEASGDFSRIVSDRNFHRIAHVIHGNEVALGGKYDLKQLYIQPTILKDVHRDNPLMDRKFYGPVLPIVPVRDVSEAIDIINSRGKPSAIYVFSKRDKVVNLILERTSSGNVVVNDTMIQGVCLELPFGGVGESGFGSFHGKDTFETFVHRKGVLKRGFNPLFETLNRIRYPPYKGVNIKLVNALYAVRSWPFESLFRYAPVFLAFLLGICLSFIIWSIL